MGTIQGRTVGEIAAEIPAAIRVFERLGIDYCCAGQTPITEACIGAGVTVRELEAELLNGVEAPERGLDWNDQSLTALHGYLVSRFHVHAREELQTIETLLTKVISVHAVRHPELQRVAALVVALQDDILPHMTKEEMILFPYVDALELAGSGTSCFGSVENPIRVMMRDHEAVGGILRNLRAATGGYQPPADGCFSYRELYRRLRDLDLETHEHIHLENNIYFPRALALEQRLAG